MADDIRLEQRVWVWPDSVEFFSTHRQSADDLYPSERRFLPRLLPEVRTVLDVGCAAGGFSRIMKSFNPALQYTGVDVNPEFIAIARTNFPESTFEVADGIHFATSPDSYDLVHSSGILHLNSRYEDIVAACYGQCSRYLLCDFRLTRRPRVEGTFTLAFDQDAEPRPVLPYIVLNVEECFAMLGSLNPAPRIVRAHGYYHPPSHMASITLPQVMMTVVLIEKGDGRTATQFVLDLPDEPGKDHANPEESMR